MVGDDNIEIRETTLASTGRPLRKVTSERSLDHQPIISKSTCGQKGNVMEIYARIDYHDGSWHRLSMNRQAVRLVGASINTSVVSDGSISATLAYSHTDDAYAYFKRIWNRSTRLYRMALADYKRLRYGKS